MLVVTVGLFAFLGHAVSADISLAAIFSNGMVLQKEPSKAHMFGSTNDFDETIVVNVKCPNSLVEDSFAATTVSNAINISFKIDNK